MRSRKDELAQAFKGTTDAQSKFRCYVGYVTSMCQHQRAETASLQLALATATQPTPLLISELKTGSNISQLS